MVNTPMDLMFKKGDNKPTTPNFQTPMNTASEPSANLSTSTFAKMGYSEETQMMAIKLLMSGLVTVPANSDSATSVSYSASEEESELAPIPIPAPASAKAQRPPRAHSSAGTSATNWRTAPGRYPSSALRSGKSVGPKSAALKSAGLHSAASTASGATPKEEEIDTQLLEDIPAWLKSLRLHKYTPCFGSMTWREMVDLDEPTMEKMGVVALGARRRLTKNFEVVKLKMGIAVVPCSAIVQSSSPHSAMLPSVPHSAAP